MTSTPVTTPVWCDSHRAQLVEQAKHWMAANVLVLPVIPVELDAEKFPKRRPNKAKLDERGNPTWEIILDKDGNKIPQFPGKAPSFWDFNGNPRLIARKHLTEETICKLWPQARIIKCLSEPHPRGYASEIGSPIGFAILPTTDMPVVDLDIKENRERLIQKCIEGGHYFETTPSGGVHVFPSLEDDMRSWSHETHKGTSYYTNWAFADDPEAVHQGEVLCQGKVCLMAPTQRGDGRSYAAGPEGLSNDKGSHVPNLTDGLGIVPIASKAQRRKSPTEEATAKPLTAKPEGTEVPHISTLVGRKAEEFLKGDLSVYGDPSEDRSAVFVSFANEVFGTENWLRGSGLAFEGSADELIDMAVDCLGTFDDSKGEAFEDKVDRILDTISRSTCDITNESGRRNSYDYQLRQLNPEAQQQKSPTGVLAKNGNTPPFVIRGYTAESIIFLPEETGLEVSIKCSNLGNKNHLLTLASLDYWESLYSYETKNGIRVDWEAAHNDLLRLRAKHSVYDASGMRGVGVWLDEGRTVVHSGGRLLVDGESVGFGEFETDYLYVKQPAVKGPCSDEPTEDELRSIFDLVSTGWNFADRSGPYWILGWIGCAYIGGALPQRPAIWTTGVTTAGKSTLDEEVMKRLLSPVGAKYWDHESTPAGIRQAIGHNAYPQIVDEMESDSPAKKKKVDDLVAMNRGSSSGSGADVAKGTTGGAGIQYSLRNPFAFSSINVGLDNDQDKNRIVVVPMLGLTKEQQDSELETTKKWEAIDTSLAQKVMARAVRMLPTIDANATTIRHAIISKGKGKVSSRYAKVQGYLLAGSRVFLPGGDALMSEAEAADFVDLLLSPTTEEEQDAAEESTEVNDSLQCLQHLLLHQVEAFREVRMDGYSRRERTQINVQEACEHFMRPGAIDLNELEKELKRHGIRIMETKGVMHLVIANPAHAGAKAIFAQTQWRAYPETLRREGANGIKTAEIAFGGRTMRMRATKFPLSQIVDETELIPAIKKEQPLGPTDGSRWGKPCQTIAEAKERFGI